MISKSSTLLVNLATRSAQFGLTSVQFDMKMEEVRKEILVCYILPRPSTYVAPGPKPMSIRLTTSVSRLSTPEAESEVDTWKNQHTVFHKVVNHCNM